MLVFGGPDDGRNSGVCLFSCPSEHQRANQHSHTCYLVDRSVFVIISYLVLLHQVTTFLCDNEVLRVF